MTKIIEFSHCGERIRSIAVFNFEQSQCCVMVMPYVRKNELGNTIIITRKNHSWISESPMADAYKLTYLSIINELDTTVNEYEN
jgi:hypothetical protein